jgi:hypothetical protein
MGRGFNIPWVGCQNTMGRGAIDHGKRVKIPRIEGSKYHGEGVNIPWIGVGYTMGRGVKIPWVGGAIYHG